MTKKDKIDEIKGDITKNVLKNGAKFIISSVILGTAQYYIVDSAVKLGRELFKSELIEKIEKEIK